MANIELRRADNGTISYRVKVRLKGHPTASGTFARLTDAKRWSQTTEAAIREGRFFKTSEAKRHTLSDAVDRYVREVLPHKPKNASNTRQQLLWWKSKIGYHTLADVTPAVIVQCRNDLLASTTRRGRVMSPATVVRYMAALSHALNITVKEWGWMDDSPMRNVSKPREPRGRERFLSDDEREALLVACKESTSRFLYPKVPPADQASLRWTHASDISSPPCLLRLLPAGAVAGRGLHPLESAAFSRRTPAADVGPANWLAGYLTVALTRSRGCLRYSAKLEVVVRMHYNPSMKTAVIPQVRVEPELRADLDAVLLPGETLTEFVETSVRRAVEFRRVQTDFAARCDASLAAYERTGISIPSDVVLSKLQAKVAARVKQLRK